jgi:hypothetical protein
MRTALFIFLSTTVLYSAPQARPATTPAAGPVKTFATPQQAADALVVAAGTNDVGLIEQLFGPEAKTVVLSGEEAQDRQRAADFVAMAHEKTSVSIDRKTGARAFVIVGDNDWPFPIPIVKRGARWSFDTNAGKREMLYRRIGSNEIDAIRICRGYVEAQNAYGATPRDGEVNQYAQRIIATAGKQDGLAWQKADGAWDGPVGEKIATAIQQGYESGEPYHGYFFKILKGQGPAAPLGQLDYVINGAMIGGFALAAAPSEYGVTGVKSFIVSQDGVVYEKDLGPMTIDLFSKMERFNPDRSWTPVNAGE